MQKLTAIFSNVSGWALVISFLIAGFTAIQSDFSWVPTVISILSLVGAILHPTNMTAGRSV